MHANEPRQNARRKTERRQNERRAVAFSFGSNEWREEIQQHYLLWPKQDRRSQERRMEDRRRSARRLANICTQKKPIRPQRLDKILTEDEKQMLNELSRSDDFL